MVLSHIRGRVTRVAPTFAVVETAGFGVKVYCTPETLSHVREGEDCVLFTSMVAVRDGIPSLYGFSTEDERDVYEILQSVSGIGAKVALAMLSVHSPDGLRAAIQHKDEAALTRVPGIGKKGAQRIILELGNKLGPAVAGGSFAGGDGGNASFGGSGQVVEALVGLGWPERDAVVAYEQAVAETPGAAVAVLLRASLQILGARR
ncbi:Holliday junction branch migration protein RuvA [Actinotignum urinale]|uniref:Holliday junction branch migration protein RuvA n=1 Tax=Actinotignum urinale TaxID=190146 RepID=UPI0003B6A059|nr:Holliday junction branch migration protein RuvA [Actinotignum urinale]MDY5129491.1 Holliday junction branch migration protein RuvA [Actinotignum urinale]